MGETVIVAIITGALSLAGTLAGSYLAHRKSAALIAYRIQQLEVRVEKHNQLIERTYMLEKRCDVYDEKFKVACHRIDDLEGST